MLHAFDSEIDPPICRVGRPDSDPDSLTANRSAQQHRGADHTRFATRKSALEAARQTDLGEYADLLDAERIVGNLHRAYAEAHGAAPGAQIDLTAALTDMVTYNNGQPLSCYA